MKKNGLGVLIFSFLTIFPLKVDSQIVPDFTVNTQVEQNGNTAEITGGATRGNNLFHSFQDFSVGTGNEAFINNEANISNIFNRITGDSVSNIDGIIRANGNANLYLINPNGIVFSENSKLDIGGSFFASTAESINFLNDEFNTVTKNTPTLDINIPIGLGFGSSPGDISIQGQPNNLVLKIPSFKVAVPNLSDGPESLPIGINVDSQKNITLVGGNINFDGGGLIAPGGNVELFSTAGNENISLSSDNDWFILNPDLTNNFQNIKLQNGAYINVGDEIAGNIRLTGKNILLQDGSVVLANTLRDSNNSIDIYATDLLKLEGNRGENFSFRFFSVSLIGADILSGDENESGNDINIQTDNLEIFDGGIIRSVNFSDSQSITGNIVINSNQIKVSGTNNIDGTTASLITTSTGIDSQGNAGDVTINANSLFVEDGARIKTDTFGSGKGGLMEIEAQNIELRGENPFINFSSTGLISTVSPDGTATSSAGSINIKTQKLDILGGAKINTSTFGTGEPGNIIIDAEEVNIIGFSQRRNASASGIVASVNPRNDVLSDNQVQVAGDILLNTNSLSILDGARIEADTTAGNGGNIFINAQTINLDGTRPIKGSFIGGISTSTKPSSFGNGGNIEISTDNLMIVNGSIIRAISLGDGNGGDIEIDAQTIEIFGSDRFSDNPLVSGDFSKINAGALTNSAGDIIINSNSINLNEFGSITASTGSENQGAGGNLFLDVNGLILNNQSSILSNTVGGSGGNITIESDFILGLNNSDITANAVTGNGGNIAIESDLILGLESRPELTPFNDITASSELGIDGTVQIKIPELDLQRELEQINPKIIATPEMLDNRCVSRKNNTPSLVLGGTGGLPKNPDSNYTSATFSLTGIKPLSSISDKPVLNRHDIANSDSDVGIIHADTVVTTEDGRTLLVSKSQITKANFCEPKEKG